MVEVLEPPIAPGLSLQKFLEWLVEVIVSCATLSRTFRDKIASIGGGMPLGARVSVRSRDTSQKHLRRAQTSEGGVMRGVSCGTGKAVTFLQWMELSSGMRKKNVPPFRLSAANRSIY